MFKIDEWDYWIAAWQDSYFFRINECRLPLFKLVKYLVSILYIGYSYSDKYKWDKVRFQNQIYEFKFKPSDNGVS